MTSRRISCRIIYQLHRPIMITSYDKRPVLRLKHLAFILMFLTSSIAFSQNTKTFTLKNGSVITGVVIEEVPGQSYKVRTADGSIIVFKAEEVEKIVLNEVGKAKEKNLVKAKSGLYYYNTSGLSLGAFATEEQTTYVVGISTVHGINLNNRLFFGAGFEMQITGFGTVVPIFFDTRVNFLKTENTPYLNLDIGAGINAINENIPVVGQNGEVTEKGISYDSGMYGKGEIGYKMGISKKLNASFGLYFSAQAYSARVWLYDDVFFSPEGFYVSYGLKFAVGIN